MKEGQEIANKEQDKRKGQTGRQARVKKIQKKHKGQETQGEGAQDKPEDQEQA